MQNTKYEYEYKGGARAEYERGYEDGARTRQKMFSIIIDKICKELENETKEMPSAPSKFWIEDESHAVNDLYDFINHNVVACSSGWSSHTASRKEPTTPLKDGSIFVVYLADMTCFIPKYMFIGNKFYLLEEIKKAKKLNKAHTMRALQNLMETTYCLINHDPSLNLATLIYKNMPLQRRKKKNGRELKRYLNEHAGAAVRWCIETNETEQLEDLLNVCNFSYSRLNDVVKNYWKDASAEVKICLEDAFRKMYIMESI